MASTFVRAAKDRAALFPQPVAFQRGRGRADIRREVRRFALRPKHVAALFLAANLAAVGSTEQKAIVSADRVNVRGQATLNSEVVTQLREGEQVTVLEQIPVKDP